MFLVLGCRECRIDWCQNQNISVGAWSPLGGPRVPILQHPALQALAEKYQRSPAQIVLRWDIQRNLVIIPKSSHQERIINNRQIFDFTLCKCQYKFVQKVENNNVQI
jgi:diketogulonate reductase-like aldo/keto reductase